MPYRLRLSQSGTLHLEAIMDQTPAGCYDRFDNMLQRLFDHVKTVIVKLTESPTAERESKESLRLLDVENYQRTYERLKDRHWDYFMKVTILYSRLKFTLREYGWPSYMDQLTLAGTRRARQQGRVLPPPL